MEESPMISVIVPVYNTEEYLNICVKSIVDQTYENLEIILVDDGASDLSGELCDKWAAKDPRITVIHKKNGGQGQARNYGIAMASGEYIGFVDSDDFIAPDMYDKLYSLLKDNDAQIAGCNFKRFSEVPFSGFPNQTGEVTVFSNEAVVADLLASRHFDSTVPNLLVQNRLAKSVLFDEGKINEDVLWPYRVFRIAEKIVHTSEQLYAYYQRLGSTMNSAYSVKRFDGLDALQKRAQEIKNDFPNLYPAAERAYAGSCMHQYQYLCRIKKTFENSDYKAVLYNRFMDADRKTVNRFVGIKYKIWYSMFAIMPEFTCFVRNRLKIGL